MDKVRTTFDEWAKIGRAELMEKEHSKTVLKFLNSIPFEKQFSFLDVGCGNGWVVRKISQIQNCKKAVGIGANDLKVFAVSESVLRPDIHNVSFLVTKYSTELPEISLSDIQTVEDDNDFVSIASIVIGIIIVGSILYLRRLRKKSQSIRT